MAQSSGARTRRCRVETDSSRHLGGIRTLCFGTERRHECRRGTDECVRHSIPAERLVEMPASRRGDVLHSLAGRGGTDCPAPSPKTLFLIVEQSVLMSIP